MRVAVRHLEDGNEEIMRLFLRGSDEVNVLFDQEAVTVHVLNDIELVMHLVDLLDLLLNGESRYAFARVDEREQRRDRVDE